MKDSRIGESLWALWDGSGYNNGLQDSIVYYTFDHVDVEEDVVRKALASSIQRDGIAYSLFESYNLIAGSIVSQGHVGFLLDGAHEEVCDEDGYTVDGISLENVAPVTFVEVPDVL